MGKKTKLREAQRQRAAESIAAVLAHSKRRAAYPALAATYGDFKPHYRDTIEAFREFAARAPEKWRCRIKSRCEDDRFLDLVTFTFACYPLAAHFVRVWLYDIGDDFVDGGTPVFDRGPHSDPRLWYIIAGRGGSLYQYATHRFLTRNETHHFLTTPCELTETRRAFWYAVARAAGADLAIALDVARTVLVEFSVASSFWKDAARFFARNPASVHEMNGLIEYIQAAWQQDNDFCLKGRSLNGLRWRRNEWQLALQAQQFGCVGAWGGCSLADLDYATGSGDTAVVWRFRQIKTGIGLSLEGRTMGHCVANYQALCAAGESAIWSLTSEHPHGRRERRITIEVRGNAAIVQCRGYANRLPSAEEVAVIKHWAQQFGLAWATPEG